MLNDLAGERLEAAYHLSKRTAALPEVYGSGITQPYLRSAFYISKATGSSVFPALMVRNRRRRVSNEVINRALERLAAKTY
ncbi:MAG: hypothetical protein N3F67_05040 [Acidilobaceae archaeon]|nr:hypothetical protein [Acidilobaceae archaeon]